MVQTCLTFEQIVAGLAETRVEIEVASLCDECHRSWTSPVIPIPRQHILQSGFVPSTSEADRILSELQEEEVQQEMLDKEIARIQDTLSRLHTARTQLVHRMKQRRSVVSAVRRVPIEVWGIIFQYASSMMTFSLDFFENIVDHPNWLRPVSLPHSLSWVCKFWTEIADSLPAIWSSIRIGGFSHLKTDIRPLLTEYLSKSSGRPLKISILEEYPDDRRAMPQGRRIRLNQPLLSPLQQDVFLMLMKQAGVQCKEFEFQFNDCDFRGEPPELIEFPNLRSLRVEIFTDPAMTRMHDWLIKILTQAPRLISLSIYNLPHFRDDVPDSLKENIETLEIGSGNANDILYLLRDYRRLKSLVVKRVFWHNGPINGALYDSLSELPHLRVLHLGVKGNPIRMGTFFDRFRAVSLTELTLTFDCKLEHGRWEDGYNDSVALSWPQTSFARMLKRHADTLTQLELEIIRGEGRPLAGNFLLAEAILAVPRLSRFKLGLEVFKDSDVEKILHVMSALEYLESDTILKLKEAIIHIQGSGRLSKAAVEAVARKLLSVVESRTKGRLAGVENSIPMTTMCVALSETIECDPCYSDAEDSLDEELQVETRILEEPRPWSDLVSIRTIEERGRAVEKAGTRCFFGRWREFKGEVVDDRLV
ncbi:hypothetical protein PM082_013890 [Marasmius tenuissimus]|nr:hypothetical protein PM082_013890 [Marasmius tenuissimus]